MGIEIERKFLVSSDAWRTGASGISIRQGYFCFGPPVAVRVRISGDKANINVKKSTTNIVRDEFEYPIPLADAELLLSRFCAGYIIEKIRYFVKFAGNRWEVDEFGGENSGLVVAELELDDPEQEFEKPDWVGDEVSGDPQYLNTSLSRKPFRLW
jgi:CYTH domain-containing protein